MFHSPGAIAVHVGPIAIRWYGVLMATAMALGLWLAHRDARRRGLDPERLLKASELALLGGLIGARLYYVAFNLDYYSQFPGKIFALWEGGLAIHGGRAGRHPGGRGLRLAPAPAPAAVSRRRRAEPGARAGDRPMGQLLQRGSLRPAHRPALEALHLAAAPAARRSPRPSSSTPRSSTSPRGTSLVFGLLVFVLRDRLERAPGALFLAYVGLYSLGRLFTEALRTDPLMLGSLRVAQLVSLLCMALALVGVPLLLRRRRPA